MGTGSYPYEALATANARAADERIAHEGYTVNLPRVLNCPDAQQPTGEEIGAATARWGWETEISWCYRHRHLSHERCPCCAAMQAVIDRARRRYLSRVYRWDARHRSRRIRKELRQCRSNQVSSHWNDDAARSVVAALLRVLASRSATLSAPPGAPTAPSAPTAKPPECAPIAPNCAASARVGRRYRAPWWRWPHGFRKRPQHWRRTLGQRCAICGRAAATRLCGDVFCGRCGNMVACNLVYLYGFRARPAAPGGRN